MSSFAFIDEEVNEVERASKDLSRFDRGSSRNPPAEWSAARTKSSFEDRAAAQGGGGGGGGGPSLPFRIREVKLFPKSIGSDPVFSIAKPRSMDQ
eukprot:CAMPEP_0197662396 /NCGR_PEP_ID=MMETSP1338-20131121/53245_1 /TAXON_ID=43686 ORGANISM="Pelagodinium beii, Strain RCC1491" /NCGR_SAMPLE_ID=MMETSP1338 /ASSEMBLY_ACC=CAM_ASM_000754 /LENGTH=94 /DNA_ID=CAMNT_0043240235 /DNA_START=63 /DNA_END=347 /DNA_ORIENTATION=+